MDAGSGINLTRHIEHVNVFKKHWFSYGIVNNDHFKDYLFFPFDQKSLLNNLYNYIQCILFQDIVYSNLSCSCLVSWWDFSSLTCYVMDSLLISCLENILSIKIRYSEKCPKLKSRKKQIMLILKQFKDIYKLLGLRLLLLIWLSHNNGRIYTCM